jgi:hypothetical protein
MRELLKTGESNVVQRVSEFRPNSFDNAQIVVRPFPTVELAVDRRAQDIAGHVAGRCGMFAGNPAPSSFTGSVAADGSFRVAGLPPDRYNVSATWPGIRAIDGSGWWLTSIQVGDKDIGDATIEVRAHVPPNG